MKIKFSELYGIAIAAEWWFNNKNHEHHTFSKELASAKRFKRNLQHLQCDDDDANIVITLK